MSRVTIKDIARSLKLSPSTVSRALRNHPDISEKTKVKVKEAAQQLDYFPDIIAQGLKSKRTNTIGIIVPEIRHDFFSSAISGIEEIAYDADFTIMVCQSNEDVKREILNLRSLVSNRIAGVLVSLSQTSIDISHFDILKKRDIPIIFFDRSHEDIKESQVLVDDYEGSIELVSYLIEKGYRRIAHIAGPDHISIGQNRIHGYREAHKRHNISVDESLIFKAGFMESDGVTAMHQILQLKNRPDAIFAVNDPVAIGALSVMKENNIKIPHDIALVGFCNNSISSMIDPPLTTVHQPARKIGRTAAKLLIEKILHPDRKTEPIVKKLQTELIIRSSA